MSAEKGPSMVSACTENEEQKMPITAMSDLTQGPKGVCCSFISFDGSTLEVKVSVKVSVKLSVKVVVRASPYFQFLSPHKTLQHGLSGTVGAFTAYVHLGKHWKQLIHMGLMHALVNSLDMLRTITLNNRSHD